MTWFSLPITQADNEAAFFDSDSAAAWLAGQPQANAPVMLAELGAQIEAYNRYATPPRERFKTMEALRKTIFAVNGEGQRRFEYKALPLLPAEQATFDSALRLWRACTVAYLHCLRACLERDSSIVRYSARVAHRVLSCLRMEQMNCYHAGAELAGQFWRKLHSVLASAEHLGVASEPVADQLLGETSESTLSGQYCMVLLLHLACPFALSRGQFAATTRWFVRWREQAVVLTEPDRSPKSWCIALDLAQDRPIHDNPGGARVERWLSLTDVLRKMRKRLELLAAGESPESLKLGSGLSSEACMALLKALSDQLKYPQLAAPELTGEAALATVGAGLESIHRLLGGKALKEPDESSVLSEEQIAVFGRVLRETEDEMDSHGSKAETWRVTRQEPGVLHLLRPAGSAEARLILRGLLAIQVPQNEHFALATISSLYARSDASLCIVASLFSGKPVPLVAEMREKTTGKTFRHPAFQLSAEGEGSSSSLVLPAGLPARALSIRFYKSRAKSPLDLRLLDLIERGGDYERWSCASA